jgi:hypothetical protein
MFVLEPKRFISVVSGLPRSGTSMMMRILEAGGMPVLTDNIRLADSDNPNGYYEFEPVKHLRQDASWLVDAYGKAVKMVYRLLCELPLEHEYKVVMMSRHIGEVVASQDAMLRHMGKDKGTPTGKVAKVLQSDLDRVQAWLRSRPNFLVLNLNYNSIIGDPKSAASELNRFLGGGLDTSAMSGVVDLSLYRHRQL